MHIQGTTYEEKNNVIKATRPKADVTEGNVKFNKYVPKHIGSHILLTPILFSPRLSSRRYSLSKVVMTQTPREVSSEEHHGRI